jgi:hypothetical protein
LAAYLAVEVDDEFEFADCRVLVPARPVDHRDGVSDGPFADAVADLPLDGQGLVGQLGNVVTFSRGGTSLAG